MDLDDYQAKAMETNLWPRVYTERQVWRIVENVVELMIDHADASGWPSQIQLLECMAQEETPLNRIIYQILGVCGEVGEIADKAKKVIRDKNGKWTEEETRAFVLETGDAVWYASAIAEGLGHSFSEVAQANLDKLADRKKRGVLGGDGDYR